MEAFLVSTAVVALAEIGDKSQLLVLTLAAQFRKPVPIILGILAATLLNHAAAGALGAWLAVAVSPRLLRWILFLSFITIAIWVLVPDKPQSQADMRSGFGVFATTVCTFFLAEMGDKTQLATFALAARYDSLPTVVAGTTLGILLADVPVVILSTAAARRLPWRPMRSLAPAMFLGLGVLVLLEAIR